MKKKYRRSLVIHAERNALLGVAKELELGAAVLNSIQRAQSRDGNDRTIFYRVSSAKGVDRGWVFEKLMSGLVARTLEGKNDSNYGVGYRK